MKKKLLILVACLVLVATVFALAACSENTKQNPIATDVKGAKVSSNGGMAVKYGNYIYFINGFSGESALNTYGKVVKGSICRVTLNANGEPDYKTLKVIVPKNAFGEDKTYGGIYIVNDYIYFNTTSVDKNSKREYKYNEGVLMRAKIDGSVTEVVKELDDNDIAMYAGDNSKYLIYAYDTCLYLVNPQNGEIKHITESNAKDKSDSNQGTVAYKYFGDFAFYTMFNYEDESTYNQDYFLYMCDLRDGKISKLTSSDLYNGNTDRKVLYQTSLLDVVIKGDEITIFYTRKDNKSTATTYYCAYTFDAKNPEFKNENEVVFEYPATYTLFRKLDNGYILGFTGKKFDVFNADGTKVKKDDANYDKDKEGANLTYDFSSDITIVDFVETETEVYVNYYASETFIYCKLFNKVKDGERVVYNVAKENIIKYCSVCFDTSYVKYDIIDNIMYYINDDVGYNAYYYVIPEDLNAIGDEDDLATGKILGKITQEDVLELICKEESNS